MNIWQMWRNNATSLTLLILCNLAVFSLGETPWIVLGCLFLLLTNSFQPLSQIRKRLRCSLLPHRPCFAQ